MEFIVHGNIRAEDATVGNVGRVRTIQDGVPRYDADEEYQEDRGQRLGGAVIHQGRVSG